MRYLLLSTLVLLLSISGNAFAQSPYFPLEKGRVQVFRYSETFSQGNPDLRVTMKTLEETERIDGEDYFIVETSAMGVTTSGFLREGKNGGVISRENAESSDHLFLDAPYEVGKSWQQALQAQVATATIIDTRATLKVSDQTYTDCLVVETVGTEYTLRTYFQKDIGMVANGMVVEGQEMIMMYLIEP
ncbi:MAG: hypothetical protein AAFQ98_16340 [Bacteroidota bacterium]